MDKLDPELIGYDLLIFQWRTKQQVKERILRFPRHWWRSNPESKKSFNILERNR